MKRISSSSTYFMKRIFPILWAVLFSSGCLIAFLSAGDQAEVRVFLLMIICASPVAAFFIFKLVLADLADEVIDNGDHLIFHKDNLKQTVELRDIINIRRSYSSKNDKIILTVQSSGPIGNKLTFLPTQRMVRFTEHPVIIDLRQHVEAAQR